MNEYDFDSPFENIPVLRKETNAGNNYFNNELEAFTPFISGSEINTNNDGETAELQGTAKPAVPSVHTCEGLYCWAKSVLNKLYNLNLSLNNSLDEQTKKAIAGFQTKYNIALTHRIDPATERALLEADVLERSKGTGFEAAALGIISIAKSRIEDWTKQAIADKPEITSSYRDPRKLWAFVLHHMAFKRHNKQGKFSDPNSYLRTGAHFCIMLDGRIIQLHSFSRFIWHAQCISPRSVSVEFEGNFPNIYGKWWINKDSKYQNRDIPTPAQYDSGKFLAQYLKIVLGTTHILAHRQSADSRENDPGPDIWFNVGQWAIDNLGLTDGGPSFKCGTGNPILPEWRTWGNRTKSIISKESMDKEVEEEISEHENYGTEQQNSYEMDQLLTDNPVKEQEAPVIDQYTLAYKLDKIKDWVYLLTYKVPDEISAKLKERNMYVKYAHNESYSNDLNVDFYRLRIDKYPVLSGVLQTPESLIRYIRLNFNSLIDTSYCDFYPYSPVPDSLTWVSNDPTGTVLKLDVKGPDNAAVVLSLYRPTGWRFSTVYSPLTGHHPVSGHREFFISSDSVTRASYFVVKGLDMLSTGVAGLGLPIFGEFGYRQGDLLWKSLMDKLKLFIDSNGGQASKDMIYSERVEWRYVYYRYKNLLEQTFGKGAGSAENSPFFN